MFSPIHFAFIQYFYEMKPLRIGDASWVALLWFIGQDIILLFHTILSVKIMIKNSKNFRL